MGRLGRDRLQDGGGSNCSPPSGCQHVANANVKQMMLASSPRPFWTLRRLAGPPAQVQWRG
eukprot:1264289-Pyramimonas_sp.AAC.1